MLAVAPELAGAAGIGAPVADVHGAVGAEHHLAGTEERVVELEKFEFAGDLEGGAVGADLVGADRRCGRRRDSREGR